MSNTKAQAAKLTKARILLLLDHAFFGTLATHLPTVWDETLSTACTNGEEIYWSPAFVDTLTVKQLMGVVAHEVMHVALGHTWRRDGRDPEAWNIATDKAINHILKAQGLELPAGVIYPDASEAGKAAESLYKTQIAKKAGSSGGNGSGKASGPNGQASARSGKGKTAQTPNDPGKCGGVTDAPKGSGKDQEAKWKVAMAQAAMVAKSQGQLPGDLERLIGEIINPRVAWETLLRDFVQRTARNDYNFSMPNRRHAGRGIILPTLISDELPEIVLAIDTSGSIGQAELDQAQAELSGILGAYETTIRVIYADARVTGDQTFTRADLPLKMQAKGGGGTSFVPAFDWVERQAINPTAMIYITDGYGTFPTAEPDFPVLWIMTTNVVAPFGETIKMG